MSEAENENDDDKASKRGWLIGGLFYLGLGSLGPANIYFAFTDPTHLDSFEGWKLLLFPFGAWLLTGFLLQGMTMIVAGFQGDPEWNIRAENAWNWWMRLGLWLVGIGVALVVAALAFGGLADFLTSLDRGTLLIAGLLLLILIALCRIGTQLRRR